MYAKIEKSKENKSRAAANKFPKNPSEGGCNYQFTDKRPDAITQRKLLKKLNIGEPNKNPLQRWSSKTKIDTTYGPVTGYDLLNISNTSSTVRTAGLPTSNAGAAPTLGNGLTGIVNPESVDAPRDAAKIATAAEMTEYLYVADPTASRKPRVLKAAGAAAEAAYMPIAHAQADLAAQAAGTGNGGALAAAAARTAMASVIKVGYDNVRAEADNIDSEYTTIYGATAGDHTDKATAGHLAANTYARNQAVAAVNTFINTTGGGVNQAAQKGIDAATGTQALINAGGVPTNIGGGNIVPLLTPNSQSSWLYMWDMLDQHVINRSGTDQIVAAMSVGGIRVTVTEKGWIHFPTLAIKYTDIQNQLDTEVADGATIASQVARIRDVLNGGSPGGVTEAEIAIACTWFGAEYMRNRRAYGEGLMLLDLMEAGVTYGTAGRTFDWETVLSGKKQPVLGGGGELESNQQWLTRKIASPVPFYDTVLLMQRKMSAWGGKHPWAHVGSQREGDAGVLLAPPLPGPAIQQNVLHAKEITLIIRWLEYMGIETRVEGAANIGEVRTIVREVIDTRMLQVDLQDSNTLTQAERKRRVDEKQLEIDNLESRGETAQAEVDNLKHQKVAATDTLATLRDEEALAQKALLQSQAELDAKEKEFSSNSNTAKLKKENLEKLNLEHDKKRESKSKLEELQNSFEEALKAAQTAQAEAQTGLKEIDLQLQELEEALQQNRKQIADKQDQRNKLQQMISENEEEERHISTSQTETEKQSQTLGHSLHRLSEEDERMNLRHQKERDDYLARQTAMEERHRRERLDNPGGEVHTASAGILFKTSPQSVRQAHETNLMRQEGDELEAQHRHDQEQAQVKKNDIGKKQDTLRRIREELNQKILKIADKKKELEASYEFAIMSLDILSNKDISIVKETSEKEKQITVYRGNIDRHKLGVEEAESQLESLAIKIASLNQILSVLGSGIHQADQELANLLETIENLQMELETMQKEIRSQEAKLEQIGLKIGTQEQEIETLNTALGGANDQLALLATRVVTARDEKVVLTNSLLA